MTGWDTLVVVDVQSGFLTTEALRTLPSRIGDFIRRDRPATVVATIYRNDALAPCRLLSGWAGCADAADLELAAPLPQLVDVVHVKNTYGCSDLTATGRTLVVGVDTDVCVTVVAAGLFDAGVDVHVALDLCDSSGGPSAHRAGGVVLQRILGEERLV